MSAERQQGKAVGPRSMEPASIMAGEFPMTEADFLKIAEMLYEDAGIHLTSSKTTLVYSRLSKRLRSLGMRSFKDYCELVSDIGGAGERMAMLASLTTNVTQFFREQHHFDHLREHFLPPLLSAAKRGGRVRLWSAGCSTGHEPYSIAMTVLSMMPDAADYDIRILASDIDPNVVAVGRAGVYGSSELDAVPAEMRRRWFRSATGSGSGPASGDVNELAFEVVDAMRDLVAFRELNLIGQWPMKGKFDAIFCRNVTIYFDQQTRERVWDRFAERLHPGGFLYMGHSERLAGPAAKVLTYDANTSYRKTV